MKNIKINIINTFFRICEILAFKLNAKTLNACLIIVACFCNSNVNAQTTLTWIGSGTAAALDTQTEKEFDNPSNWNLLRAPLPTDNIIISFTKSGIVNLGANTTVTNLTIINLSNKSGIVNVGAFTLRVNGSTNINLQNDHPKNNIYIGVNDATSAGTIDFMGDVTLGNTINKDGVYLMGNPNSTIICRGNLILNQKAQVAEGLEPGTLLFDGTGIQNFVFNNSKSCSFKNVVIGNTNNPTVVIGGTSTPDNILGNLTVNGSSVLDINTRQLNRNTNGGSLFMKNTSTLRLQGSSSTPNGGNASIISGSNFPSGFTNIVLDSTSTVEFYGTNQSIPGAAQQIKGYGNLSLVNNTKTVMSSFAMFRNLKIAANTTLSLGNFNDTLKSNNQTTAYVSSLPSTAAITYGTGGFVIERHLAAYKSWRLLATPVDIATSPSISAAWREGNSGFTSTGYGTQITGPQGPSVASNTAVLDLYTQRGSIKSYNAATDSYVEVTNANTTKIANTAGYFVFIRGDRSVGVTGTTNSTNLRIKGRIRTGDQTFTVPINKFASVGNPYPSRIDFRTIYSSTIAPSYYVWNPNPAGTLYNAGKYDFYVNYGDGNYRLGGPSGTIRNYIESGQAVFIQSITGGSITVKESDKFDGSSLVSRGAEAQREAVNNSALEINLLTKDGNGEEVLADAAVINFDDAYSNNIDNNDVRKILNTSDNLAIRKGFVNLILETRAALNVADTILINLSNTRVGSYRLNFKPSLLVYPTLQAFIVDKFLQTETPVSLSDASDYSFTTTSVATSRASDRFMITFKAVSPAVFTAIKAERKGDNSVAVSWHIANENNINYYEIERSLDGINFKTINSQMPTANNMGNPYYTFIDATASTEKVWYRVKANGITGAAKFSGIANVTAVEVNTKNGISIYPNPVVDGTINLYFNNKAKGKYSVLVFDNNGMLVTETAADVQNNTSVKRIKIISAAGMYRVTVKDAKGNSVVVPFVIL